jgi:hypothetical protein
MNMSERLPTYPGVPIDFGGELGVLIVPGLSLDMMEREDTQALLEEVRVEGVKVAVRMRTIAKLVLPALQRNYPVTEEQLVKHMDANNWLALMSAVLGNSGMKPTRELPNGMASPSKTSTGAG